METPREEVASQAGAPRRLVMRRLTTAVYRLLLLCLAVTSLETLSAQQYSLVQWKHKDGLPSTVIYAVTQTPDGFLWLGTADGLVRYDGFQFVHQSMARFGLRPLGQVRALQASGDGALYAGTASGVVLRLTDSAAVHVSVGSPVVAITLLSNEIVQVRTIEANLYLDSITLAPVKPTSLPSRTSELEALDGTTSVHVPASQSNDEADANSARLAQEIGTKIAVRKVLRDRTGGTWFATAEHGVFLTRRGSHVEHFYQASGLSSDRTWDIYEDREGNIWVATQNGLNRLRPDKFVTYTERDGLRSVTPSQLAPSSDGRLWIGSTAGLELFDGKKSVLVHGNEAVGALVSDGRGGVFAAANRSLYRFAGSEVQKVPPKWNVGPVDLMAQTSDGHLWLYDRSLGLRSLDASPLDHIDLSIVSRQTVMAAGSHRELWLGLATGAVLLLGEHDARTFTQDDGLTGAAISFISPQADGTLWVATNDGLAFYDGHHFIHWGTNSGLPGDLLLWALPDTLGHLWIGYNFGVAEVTISDLTQQAAGKSSHVEYRLYDDGDGLQGNPDVHGAMPVARTTDGRLWFTMSEGVAMIDPAHIIRNLLPPPTHILQVTADGSDVPLDRPIKLKPLTRVLQIYYAGLSLSDPRKMHFRYRLDGFDDKWQEAATRHNAFYTNLRPGSYLFRVLASNNDGVWNETGATLPLEILPAYYQTDWFRALCFCLALSLMLMIYRFRLQLNAREIRSRYEVRMAERNRIAQELHDNLIQEMMGVGLQLEIADEVTPADAAAKRPVHRALQLAQAVIGHGRGALHKLRQQPLSLAEMTQTLQDTARASGSDSLSQLNFIHMGAERLLQSESGEEILQIAREAVRNAIRHGPGAKVFVHVLFDPHQLTVIIRDNGRGIPEQRLHDSKPGHYGIRGMHERASRIGATLSLQSSAASGTEWRLTVPGAIAYQPEHDGRDSSFRQLLRSKMQRRGAKIR
jgi:signal transduction histidine kinase/ligand-binding sensor domain-containing protein